MKLSISEIRESSERITLFAKDFEESNGQYAAAQGSQIEVGLGESSFHVGFLFESVSGKGNVVLSKDGRPLETIFTALDPSLVWMIRVEDSWLEFSFCIGSVGE